MDKEIQKLEEAFKAKVGAPQDDPSPKRRHPLNYPPPTNVGAPQDDPSLNRRHPLNYPSPLQK